MDAVDSVFLEQQTVNNIHRFISHIHITLTRIKQSVEFNVCHIDDRIIYGFRRSNTIHTTRTHKLNGGASEGEQVIEAEKTHSMWCLC